MSLASLTANGEEQGWQQPTVQKVHYLQNYDHGGDGGHGDDEVEDDDDNTLLALPRIHEVWMPRTLQNNVLLLNFVYGREAFD